MGSKAVFTEGGQKALLHLLLNYLQLNPHSRKGINHSPLIREWGMNLGKEGS
jgi:hypothetical protein